MAKRQRRRRRERRREHAQRTGWQTRHSVITGAGVAAGAALGLAAPALGASEVLYVGTLADDGSAAIDCAANTNTDCTLRQAITEANANTGQYDYVVFKPTVTGNVALTAGQIPITDSVYIYGNGPAVNTITAAPNSRIFDVDPSSGDGVGIYGLTLTGGNVTGNGGAIRNADGRLHVADAVLSGNTASGFGGAVYETGTYDGGIYDRFAYTTFSGNHADGGGAIYAASSWGRIAEVTFTGNGADSGSGGAIAGDAGTLFDSTISGNNASVSGGGAAVFDTIRFYGTILANNAAGASAPDVYAPGGGYGSYDLIENVGSLGTPPSIITGQDPQLGSLDANGGNTPTLKPSASSPVVDQSYSYALTDQRGAERIVDNPNKSNVTGGDGSDIGAVELSLAEGPQGLPSPPPPPLGAVHKKKCKKKHKRPAQAAKRCKKKKKRSASSAIRFHAPPQAAAWPGGDGRHPFRLGR
jgi:predicted outer membrane repeat protein